MLCLWSLLKFSSSLPFQEELRVGRSWNSDARTFPRQSLSLCMAFSSCGEAVGQASWGCPVCILVVPVGLEVSPGGPVLPLSLR